jgi:hypothetical protein
LKRLNKHGDAQKIRITKEGVGDITEDKWICWNKINPKFRRQVGIWENPRILMEHGDGFPLLFQFMKFIIILFVWMFIFQGIYFFIVNMIFFFEEDKNFTITNFLSVDIIIEDEKASDTLIRIYEAIALLTNLMLMVITWIFWIRQKHYKENLDKTHKTDADFWVMMYNLPKDMICSTLKSTLIDVVGVNESDIIYINKWYEYDHILKIKQEQVKWMLIKKHLEVYRNKKQENGEPYEDAYPSRRLLSTNFWQKFPREETINEKLKHIKEELLQENNKMVSFWGVWFVVFRTEDAANKVIKFYNLNKKWRWLKKYSSKLFGGCWVHKDNEKYLIDRKRVYAVRAAEPKNIIWENVHVKSRRRWWIASLIYLICVAVLVPSYFLINLFYELKREYTSDNEEGIDELIVTYVFQVLLSLAIIWVNIVIEIYIFVSTTYERQMTYTEQELSVVGKMTMLKYLGAILIPFLGNSSRNVWFENHGLVEEVTFIVIVLNVGEGIRIIFYWKFFLIWALRKYETWKGEKSEITQKQANYLYENDPIEMGKIMSVTLVFTLTILFFSPIIPGLWIFGIIGSIYLYWVLKFLIIRRKIVKYQMNAKLLVTISRALKLGILTNAIMSFIFYNSLLEYFSLISLFQLIGAILFFVLPMRDFAIKLFYKKPENDDLRDFYESQEMLIHYDVSNPITSSLGVSRLEGRSFQDAIKRCIIK